jgi:hypothetical protein
MARGTLTKSTEKKFKAEIWTEAVEMPFSTMMVFISPAMMLLPMEEEVDRTGEVVPMEEMEGTA